MGKIPYYLFGQEPDNGTRKEIEIKLGNLDSDQTLDTLSLIFVNEDIEPQNECTCEEERVIHEVNKGDEDEGLVYADDSEDDDEEENDEEDD